MKARLPAGATANEHLLAVPLAGPTDTGSTREWRPTVQPQTTRQAICHLAKICETASVWTCQGLHDGGITSRCVPWTYWDCTVNVIYGSFQQEAQLSQRDRETGYVS